jgi:hypothetical protein
MKLKIHFILVVFSTVILATCKTNEKKDQANDSIPILTLDSMKAEKDTVNKVIKDTVNNEKKKIELNNHKYICPQSDQVGDSDKPGVCLACGMELIENPDYTPKKPK